MLSIHTVHPCSAPELFSVFHLSWHMSQIQLPHPLKFVFFLRCFCQSLRQANAGGWLTPTKRGALLIQSQSSTGSTIDNLSLIQESRRGRSGMYFDSGEHVMLRPCHAVTVTCPFLQLHAQNLFAISILSIPIPAMWSDRDARGCPRLHGKTTRRVWAADQQAVSKGDHQGSAVDPILSRSMNLDKRNTTQELNDISTYVNLF